jgi:hypothetical protein
MQEIIGLRTNYEFMSILPASSRKKYNHKNNIANKKSAKEKATLSEPEPEDHSDNDDDDDDDSEGTSRMSTVLAINTDNRPSKVGS